MGGIFQAKQVVDIRHQFVVGAVIHDATVAPDFAVAAGFEGPDRLFPSVPCVTVLAFQLQQVAQPHQSRAILLAAGSLAFDEHFEAEEGHPEAFDREGVRKSRVAK